MKISPPDFCKICKSDNLALSFFGLIRDGAFGNYLEADLYLCNNCGAEFLDELSCLDYESYKDGKYRSLLNQNYNIDEYQANHIHFVNFFLNSINNIDLKDKVIADIGCGGGALLDHLSYYSKTLIGIDPDPGWSQSLIKRGHIWYSSIEEASGWSGKIDIAISSMVIEHVYDPVKFINEICQLLSPTGLLIITTPNREEILMDLMPSEFKKFFYRRQHRWYFNKHSLENCFYYSNMEILEVKTKHRWGLSNAINWCLEKKPPGEKNIKILNKEIDFYWKDLLENNNKADTLFLIAKRKK
jgi:2-polyprenyl-3-methyl-5-hydroxy-6-metoxy-1,4-benzoquinol methylase